MFFTVLGVGRRHPSAARSRAFLLTDNWNDWFKYQTMYSLIYIDHEGSSHIIGAVKIGEFGMADGQPRPLIPDEFDDLSPEFFSLGQDDSYYQHLNELGDQLRDRILTALRDVAANPELFERSLEEDVTGVSLLRYVTTSTVRGQFRRLAVGEARLSSYEFSYVPPTRGRSRLTAPTLTFIVTPDSDPPTNIHVLIGRNGVGKTTILHHMSQALVEDRANPSEVGVFQGMNDPDESFGLFASLISVTFSAFDPFEPISMPRNKSTGLQYAYVGLKRIRDSAKEKTSPPKSPARLATEFSHSVKACLQGARFNRWRNALSLLEADPIFREADIAGLAEEGVDDDELRSKASAVFSLLSSGHKIVLLTITRLVETVEERTLVLLDEPEAHLHPPLLSAFVRALSGLLINRNGVAIVATHSPVVLQEVPKSCVWKIRRSGRRLTAERPEIETFGENIGILTREIFGLEVTQTGFHRLLSDRVVPGADYDDVVGEFDGQLGGEARAIVRGMVALRNAEGEA